MIDVSIEAIRQVENPVKNYFKQEVFDEVNVLGDRFFQRNPRRERNFGDWKLARSSRETNTQLNFSKGKEKQRLIINFENKQMTGFDFMLSDGEIVINLQKNQEGRLVVSRKDKLGRSIPGSEDLSPKEYIELSNFPVKFWIDRNVNAIIDTVDPTKVIRYVLPVASTVALVGHTALANFGKPNDEAFINQAFLDRPVLSQPIGDQLINKPNNINYFSSIPIGGFEFAPLDDKNKIIYEDIKPSDTENQSLIEDLKLVHEFTLPISDNGFSRKKMIEKYLMNAGASGGDLFRYRQPGDRLSESLRIALDSIKENGDKPLSQNEVYRFISALREFNSGKKTPIPEDILRQANAADKNILTAYDDGGYFRDPDGNLQPNFNRGLIKGNEFFGAFLPGDFLVTTNQENGIVMNVKKDMNGNVKFAVIWSYNEITGEVTKQDISVEDFALSFAYGK